jgi:hypothetical protein
MYKSNYTFGQSIGIYQTPSYIFNSIIKIYEENKKNLYKVNKNLAGNIENELSLLYNNNGREDPEVKNHNLLPLEVLNWFRDMFNHYLLNNLVTKYEGDFHSIWINEMKDNEYNPSHIHSGNLFTGLSSVMILKLPHTTGIEYNGKNNNPQNGKLTFLSASIGQFSKPDYQPNLKLGDFFIFPYDLRHCVSPFNSSNDTRITLAANFDVKYNPLEIGQ